MSEYNRGDKVEATRDVGGLLGSVSAGSQGEVLGSTLFGDHYEVRFGDQVVEVPKDDIKRRGGGGIFD